MSECDCDYWHSEHRRHCATNYPTYEFPAHHIVGADLGFTCTNCGGHTSTTPPCIPARAYPLLPAQADEDGSA